MLIRKKKQTGSRDILKALANLAKDLGLWLMIVCNPTLLKNRRNSSASGYIKDH